MFQKINCKKDVGVFVHVLEKNKIPFHTGNFLLNTPLNLKYKTSGNLGFLVFSYLNALQPILRIFVLVSWSLNYIVSSLIRL